METLERRPLGTFASAFYIFSCVISAVGADGRMWATALIFAGFACVLFLKIKIPFRRAVTAIAAGMLAATVFSGFAVDVKLAEKQSLSAEERDIVGTVTSVRYASSWEGCYTVKTDGMKVILTSDNCELASGDMISCTVVYDGIDLSDDNGRYLLSDGVVLSCTSVGDVSVIGRDRGAEVSLAELRGRLSAKLRSSMSAESGGFAAALLLGDRSHLADEVTRDFRCLGISHVLALSGTHLTMLFSFVGGLFSDRRKLLRLLVLCPAVLFYMLLTGFSPSVVRAGIMFIIAAVSSVFAKKADSFTSLSVAVLLICILNPYSVFDIGLMLSYAAVIGLVISGEIRRKLFQGRSSVATRILGALIPAFVVPAVLLLLMWFTFGEVSLVSPAANVILVPVISAFIPVLAVLLLMSWLPALFIPLSAAADVLISGVLDGVQLAAESIDPMLSLKGRLPLAMMALFVLFAMVAALFCGKNRRIAAYLSVMLLCFTLVAAQLCSDSYNRGMTVCYSAVKTDEAVYVISEGHNILIDIGRYPSAVKEAAKLGSVYGSDKIDALILTHIDRSHILALAEICSNYYLSSLWVPASEEPEIAYSLKNEAESRGVEVYTYVPGEYFAFGDCTFVAPSLNGSAVSFSLEYDGQSFLYSSESDASFDSDVNVVGVHGTRVSGTLPISYGKMIVPTAGAVSFDSVPDSTFVTDTALVRFRKWQAPFVNCSPQE